MKLFAVPDVRARVGEWPLGDDVLAWVGVAVHEDGVDVVGAVVALERRDVWPEVVGWRSGIEELSTIKRILKAL